MVCSNIFDTIIKIEAISDSNIEYYAPLQKYSKVLALNTDVVVKNDGGGHIDLIIDDMSATCKDDYNSTLAFSKHTITVGYDMKNERGRLKEEESQLKMLHNGWYHLLITFYGGTQAIVRCADRQHFSFSEAREGDSTKCSIAIQNMFGIQFLE